MCDDDRVQNLFYLKCVKVQTVFLKHFRPRITYDQVDNYTEHQCHLKNVFGKKTQHKQLFTAPWSTKDFHAGTLKFHEFIERKIPSNILDYVSLKSSTGYYVQLSFHLNYGTTSWIILKYSQNIHFSKNQTRNVKHLEHRKYSNNTMQKKKEKKLQEITRAFEFFFHNNSLMKHERV